ncbi:hypothetical protein [Pedobacter miscanthi]|uniref:hypothetical protein n=1 Tax=Pedobacter miscanthi TaxID=2259170 RepID=UPI00292E572A|nr:hypothetical protein [Pedobacter miscanthi]
MIGEQQAMKYLKIEDNKGFFIKENEQGTTDWIQIDLITKDDLFFLLSKAVSEDFEIEEFKEDILSNKAHQIIYKNLHEKFSDLLLNKTRFKDESESLYKGALEKYKSTE